MRANLFFSICLVWLTLLATFSSVFAKTELPKDSVFQQIWRQPYPDKANALSLYADKQPKGIVREIIALLETELKQLERSNGNPLTLAILNITIDKLYNTNLRQYQKGVPYAVKALQLADQYEDESGIWLKIQGRGHSSMSHAHYWESDTQRAIEEEQLAYHFFERAKDTFQMGISLNNLGVRHSEMGQFHQAIDYYKKSISYFEKAQSDKWVIRSNYCMVVDLIFLQKYAQAKEILQSILPEMEAAQHTNYTLAVAKMGEAEMYLGNDEVAGQYLLKAHQLAKESKSWNRIFVATQKLQIWHERQGNLQKAYELAKAQLVTADSLTRQILDRKNRAAQNEYDQLLKKQKIDQLEFEQQIQKSRFRNTIALLALLFVVVLGAIGFWAYRQALLRKQAVLFSAKEMEIQKLRERFILSVTHELRTPLTLVLSSLEALDKEPLPEKARQLVDLSGKNADHLLFEINQLLDVNQLEANAMRLHPSMGEAVHFVRTLFEHSQSQYQDKGHHWKLALPPDPIACEIDFQKLETILKNLLNNAVKHTPVGTGITLQLQTSHLNQMTIIVSDNGPGIPPDQADRIFDWYYQAPLQNGQGTRGSGIGLALCKELAHLMQGDLTLETEPGQGTTFTLSIPFEPAGSSAMTDEQSAVSLSAPTNEQLLPTLLLIEDHTELANHISEILSPHYRVFTCQNAQQGIDWAIKQLPDIIVTDLMLPDSSGFEVCSALKSDMLTDHIPILILTARTDEASRFQGLETRADAFLTKPFKLEELLLSLNNLLQNRRRLQFRYTSQQNIFEPETDPFVARIMTLLADHYNDNDFNVAAFAKKMKMSRVQLFKKTRSLLDITPGALIRQFRLEKSRQLLQTTSRSVSEIAYACGFSSPEYFSTVYKEYFHRRPSEEKRGVVN